MTVININNISGIASVNAQSNSLELFDNTGASLLDLNANTATFPGGISVGGTVTYDDVTNIDSIGVVTARSGVHFGTAASGTLVVGDSDGIGIGTDNPTSKLHLSGIGTQTIRVDTDGTALSIYNHSQYIGFIGNDSGKLFINAGGTEDTLSLRTNGTERLGISSEGIITKPYQVAFFAYCTISDHDLNAGDIFAFNAIATNTPAAFNTNHTTYNGTNVFDTTNRRFTAPVAGLYHFTVTAYFRRDADPMTAIVPYVNNSVVQAGNDVFFFSSDNVLEGHTMSGSVTLQLAANDYVSVHRRSASQSGTTRFYGPHSHFCGHLIG